MLMKNNALLCRKIQLGVYHCRRNYYIFSENEILQRNGITLLCVAKCLLPKLITERATEWVSGIGVGFWK